MVYPWFTMFYPRIQPLRDLKSRPSLVGHAASREGARGEAGARFRGGLRQSHEGWGWEQLLKDFSVRKDSDFSDGFFRIALGPFRMLKPHGV